MLDYTTIYFLENIHPAKTNTRNWDIRHENRNVSAGPLILKLRRIIFRLSWRIRLLFVFIWGG